MDSTVLTGGNSTDSATGWPQGILWDVRDLEFGYESDATVLDGVSLTAERGSLTGVVGPSGCGKSTLLYLLAGLHEPTGGMISHHAHRYPERHPLTMVFQKETLLPWLTVANNVCVFDRYRRGLLGGMKGNSGDEELAAKRDTLLSMVHLDDKADAFPYQLSGGMRRRLQFLTAVAPNPLTLLLDEPFSSVDEPTRIGIHQDVFDTIRLMDITAMLVTHDLAEAISFCDRVIILTQRPATIAHTHEIPFGRERNMLDLRSSPEYQDCYRRLWDDMREQIAITPTESSSLEGTG